MAPLTNPRLTPKRSGDRRHFGLAANAVVHQGALAAINGAGLLVPMTAATGLRGVGRAESSADNTGGLGGAIGIEVGAGIYPYDNSAGADEIGVEDIGKECFGVDDQTVALTDGDESRSVAGIIFDVDAQGVWVKFS